MRKLTRSILATTAVVGLLAIPVVGAGAAQSGSTTATLTLDPATSGTLAITVPTGDFTDPVALGSTTISNGGTLTTDPLGTVAISDTRTGLVRTVTVTATSGLDNAAASFCLDSNGTTTGVQCSSTTGEFITLANGLYNFNAVTTGGDALTVTPTLPGVGKPLGATATAAWAVSAGTFTASWQPTFGVTLLGTEVAGTYYGAVTHSVT